MKLSLVLSFYMIWQMIIFLKGLYRTQILSSVFSFLKFRFIFLNFSSIKFEKSSRSIIIKISRNLPCSIMIYHNLQCNLDLEIPTN